MCYKQKMTFLNAKFDQICLKIATFRPFFGLQNPQKHLGIRQLGIQTIRYVKSWVFRFII